MGTGTKNFCGKGTKLWGQGADGENLREQGMDRKYSWRWDGEQFTLPCHSLFPIPNQRQWSSEGWHQY